MKVSHQMVPEYSVETSEKIFPQQGHSKTFVQILKDLELDMAVLSKEQSLLGITSARITDSLHDLVSYLSEQELQD